MNKPIEPIQMPETSLFSKLVKIDCNGHTEKKGKFTYLSWPWAVKMLRENDPQATWTVEMFGGMPYCKTPNGHFVQVSVKAGGVTLSQIHPILNNNNKPIDNPSSFDINTSIQRCLVKAIALHGLGLYIYAGEDLPEDNQDVEVKESKEEMEMAQKATEIFTTAASKGTQTLDKQLKIAKEGANNKEWFSKFWIANGETFKRIAKQADVELAGVM